MKEYASKDTGYIKWEITTSPIKMYDIPLITYNENEFIIGLANVNTKAEKPIITVEQQVSFPMDCAKHFLHSLINVLTDYEKTYKNGKGLDIQR